MSKAVLVMDMPESCSVCDLLDEEDFGDYCGVPWCEKNVEDYIATRPDFCPLRKLPKRLSENEPIVHEGREIGVRTHMINYGWNACLDAIMGGNSGE